MRAGRFLLSLVSLALFCAVWEGASRAGLISNRLIPPPSHVAEAAWELLTEGLLLRDVYWSSRRALAVFRSTSLALTDTTVTLSITA